MNVMKKFIGVLVIVTAFNLTGSAQCKGIVKANLAKLSPYTHNGQQNSASLPEGGVADFKISCYKGLTYRLALAFEEKLGNVTFRVLDEDNNEVYNSANNEGSWDFNVDSSQELTVEVNVPLAQKNLRGCVALLVGFREPKSVGSMRPM